jgi:hypothetical protein
MRDSFHRAFVRETTIDKDPYIISPSNAFIMNWQMFTTIILLYSCIATPAQIALYDDLSRTATIINWTVDILFFIDIFIIFNSAYIDEEYNIIDNRWMIVKNYLSFWFWIDLVAILPFDLFVPSNGSAANLVRFIRIGRITKVLKLLKLMRLIKLQKSNSFSIQDTLIEFFNISQDFKWFVTFIAYFAMTTHVIACLWLIIATIDVDTENSWRSSFDLVGENESSNRSELYLTSFYFTVTTITTVGYGDMSANTFLERIVCIVIMIIGVIAFSLASGALTNYISQQESKSAAYEEKMGVLEKLMTNFNMPRDLYIGIRRNIEQNYIEDQNLLSAFVKDLPLDFRRPLSMIIYQNVIKSVDFF